MLRADCIEPNGENASEAELLVAMEAAPNKRSYVRLTAIRALLKGYTRAQVGELFGRSERMVRLWIVLFNRGGVDANIRETPSLNNSVIPEKQKIRETPTAPSVWVVIENGQSRWAFP